MPLDMLEKLTHFLQGSDLELSTSCLEPYILALLLEPIIISATAQPNTLNGSVCIIWDVSILQGQF